MSVRSVMQEIGRAKAAMTQSGVRIGASAARANRSRAFRTPAQQW